MEDLLLQQIQLQELLLQLVYLLQGQYLSQQLMEDLPLQQIQLQELPLQLVMMNLFL